MGHKTDVQPSPYSTEYLRRLMAGSEGDDRDCLEWAADFIESAIEHAAEQESEVEYWQGETLKAEGPMQRGWL